MNVVITILLLLLSGIFSGLTLGLMSLDPYELKRKISVGDKRAKKIYEVRKNGNLLLVTLLLGNMSVITATSIFLGTLLPGFIAGLVATFLITIFGEIIPQAFFSRFTLELGSNMIWLVKIFIIILFPIAWPISWMLDKLIGLELPTIYSKRELLKILEEHTTYKSGTVEGDEERIARGALTYGDKTIKDIMTPRSVMFALEKKEKVTARLISRLKKSGYSRFPVYDNTVDNITGILYLRELLGRKFGGKTVQNFSIKKIYSLHINDNLDFALEQFLKTKNHLSVVINEFNEVSGVVTIEDILEEIIGVEIMGEFDRYENLRKIAQFKKRRPFFASLKVKNRMS